MAEGKLIAAALHVSKLGGASIAAAHTQGFRQERAPYDEVLNPLQHRSQQYRAAERFMSDRRKGLLIAQQVTDEPRIVLVPSLNSNFMFSATD